MSRKPRPSCRKRKEASDRLSLAATVCCVVVGLVRWARWSMTLRRVIKRIALALLVVLLLSCSGSSSDNSLLGCYYSALSNTRDLGETSRTGDADVDAAYDTYLVAQEATREAASAHDVAKEATENDQAADLATARAEFDSARDAADAAYDAYRDALALHKALHALDTLFAEALGVTVEEVVAAENAVYGSVYSNRHERAFETQRGGSRVVLLGDFAEAQGISIKDAQTTLGVAYAEASIATAYVIIDNYDSWIAEALGVSLDDRSASGPAAAVADTLGLPLEAVSEAIDAAFSASLMNDAKALVDSEATYAAVLAEVLQVPVEVVASQAAYSLSWSDSDRARHDHARLAEALGAPIAEVAKASEVAESAADINPYGDATQDAAMVALIAEELDVTSDTIEAAFEATDHDDLFNETDGAMRLGVPVKAYTAARTFASMSFFVETHDVFEATLLETLNVTRDDLDALAEVVGVTPRQAELAEALGVTTKAAAEAWHETSTTYYATMRDHYQLEAARHIKEADLLNACL